MRLTEQSIDKSVMDDLPLDAERRRRVLIVDDHRDGADSLGWLVEELGNDVQVTYGAVTALEVAMTFRPQLIITDVVMPGMDGYGFVRQVRKIPDFAEIPIVAITGRYGGDSELFARSSGFDKVLCKPVSLKDIKAILSATGMDGPENKGMVPPPCARLPAQRRSELFAASWGPPTAMLANCGSSWVRHRAP